MKKAFSVLLALSMVFALAACGGADSTTPSAADDNAASDVADNNDADADTDADAGADADGDAAPAGDADFDVVRLGAIGPLTGGASQYGEAVRDGAIIAIEEINANGGILGAQIEYTFEDDQHNPIEAINAYEKLMNQGIDVLLGAVTSAPSVAVAQRAVDDGIPVISASATQEDFTLVGENIFRTCFIDPYQGELMANYARDEHGAKTAAVLYDTGNDYSEGIAEAFRDEATRIGMEVVAFEGYPTDTVDFNSQLTKIKDANPDVIMAPCYYEEAALIIVQARNLGIESVFVGPDGWDGVLNQVDESNYDLLNNSYFCNQYSRESTDPAMQNFISTYKEKYGIDENMFAVLGYDSIYILKAAIEDAGTLEYAAVVEAMKNVSSTGLTGTTTFDANRNPVRAAVITEFRDGEAVVATTYDFDADAAPAEQAADDADEEEAADDADADAAQAEEEEAADGE